MKSTKPDPDRDSIARRLALGLLGAFIILAGDLLMGWGVRDDRLTGIAAQLSPYLSLSDGRMFWAAVCGFSGVPLAVAGHSGICRMLRPYAPSLARLYALGNLGFLAFGGAGVHVSSVEAAFFYRRMTAADPASALDGTVRFALLFLLPLYFIMIACWAVMVYAHLRALGSGLTPYPRRLMLFSMPVGTLLACTAGLFGNRALANALMVGAFSVGNIWTLAGHLWLLRRLKENP